MYPGLFSCLSCENLAPSAKSLTARANRIWRLRGGGPNRFEIAGYFFQIAPYDDPFCGDWIWDRDDIVLYIDYDHPGWYIPYHVRLGTYCHVMYPGS